MAKFSNKNRGFVKIILIVIAALVLVKYVYDIDVIGFLTAGKFKELLDQLYRLGARGWQEYSGILIKFLNYSINFVKNLIGK